jgi:hypothetical protein
MVSLKTVNSVQDHVKDVSGLAGLFFEAADTERRMPGVRMGSIKSCWPDYPEEANLAFGYNQVEVRLAKAHPSAISRYDQVLELSLLLELDDRKIVWAASHSAARRQRGPAWKKISMFLNMHPVTVKRRFNRALLDLWYKMLYCS